jgi:histidinol-phosphate/aromatic aminotransferase/cobyric acid decarboxylase-like protein
MDPDSVRQTTRVPHGGTAEEGVLEFSANVNPETPDGVRPVYEAAFGPSRRYSDDEYTAFRGGAASAVGCEPEEVIPTAGGLAAIRLAVATTVEPGDRVIVPAPSFAEYAREVRLQGGEPEYVGHDAILSADPTDATLAVVCNPNNPTGNTYDSRALRTFVDRCRDAGTLVLVDEAFLGFTDRPSVAGIPGVVIGRSLTKLSGLPGLRAGYAVATGERRDTLETARHAWSMGTPAATVGAYCLEQTAFAERTRERIETERSRMRAVLSESFGVYPSEAPFLLLDVGDRDATELVRACRELGVEIRDATTFRGLDSHVRVAVRLPDENDRLLEVLTDV